MTRARNMIAAMLALAIFAAPAAASAAALTAPQASAVVALLKAFGVDARTLARVEAALGNSSGSVSVPSAPPAAAAGGAAHVGATGSRYPASAVGYDLSFNTNAYPVMPFGFSVVGVTAGKAFTHNARLASEYSWARLASFVSPTLYLNLNAPFGTTVAGHLGAPKSCPGDTNASPTAASTTAPSACEGYDYGYAAAADAFAYAKSNGVSSTLWWLDIEAANSWAQATSTNDAVIQGALDALNEKGVTVGIYSVPYMWKEIAGDGFVPAQLVNGASVTTPTWFPIGINTQVGALNACNTKASFIPGSPIWLLQYELDRAAVDQNVAC